MSSNTKVRVLTLFALTLMVSSSAFAGWTAIAYNPTTKKWGRSQCASTADNAINTALAECGEGCQRVAYARDGFVALAVGDNGWATGNLHADPEQAADSSLQRCESLYTNCAILAAGSSYKCE